LGIIPSLIDAGREAGRVNGKVRLDGFKRQRGLRDQLFQERSEFFLFKILGERVVVDGLMQQTIRERLSHVRLIPASRHAAIELEARRKDDVSEQSARTPERLNRLNYALRERAQQFDKVSFLVRLREVVFMPLLLVGLSLLLRRNRQRRTVHLLAQMVLNREDVLALWRAFFEVGTSARGRIQTDDVGLGGRLRRDDPTGLRVVVGDFGLSGDLYASGFS